jgi:hypothetical protein
MGEKTVWPEQTKLETVLPRTLVPKKDQQLDANYKYYEVTNVLGGTDGDVLCAMFLDADEAQAWIIASCHFGQPVQGYKLATKIKPDMVYEQHPDLVWPHDDCGGPGMPPQIQEQVDATGIQSGEQSPTTG